MSHKPGAVVQHLLQGEAPSPPRQTGDVHGTPPSASAQGAAHERVRLHQATEAPSLSRGLSLLSLNRAVCVCVRLQSLCLTALLLLLQRQSFISPRSFLGEAGVDAHAREATEAALASIPMPDITSQKMPGIEAAIQAAAAALEAAASGPACGPLPAGVPGPTSMTVSAAFTLSCHSVLVSCLLLQCLPEMRTGLNLSLQLPLGGVSFPAETGDTPPTNRSWDPERLLNTPNRCSTQQAESMHA